MKKVLLVVFLSMVSAVSYQASAARINHEMKFAIDQIDAGGGDNVDINTLVYTYYFDKLDSYYGPYAQADFLGRHSKLGFSFQRLKSGYNPEQMTLSGRAFFGQNRRLGVGFSRSTLDIDIDVSGELTNFEFLANLTKTSRLSFSLTQYDEEEDSPFGFDVSSTLFNVSYEIVNKLRRQKYVYMGITGTIAETDETDKFFGTTDTVSVTSMSFISNYYLNRKVSLDYIGYNEISSDVNGYDLAERHTFGVTHYLNKEFFYQFLFSRTTVADDSTDSNSIQLGTRF